MSDYIGLVFCGDELRQIINPDYDAQLDDPALTTAPDETRVLVRVPRSVSPNLHGVFSLATIASIHEAAGELRERFAWPK